METISCSLVLFAHLRSPPPLRAIPVISIKVRPVGATGGEQRGKKRETKNHTGRGISHLSNNLLPDKRREKVGSACYPIFKEENMAKACEITRDLDKAYKLKIMLSLRGEG